MQITLQKRLIRARQPSWAYSFFFRLQLDGILADPRVLILNNRLRRQARLRVVRP